jgi:hypothetical protein
VIRWRRACGSNGGGCVEVGVVPDGLSDGGAILVRDSKQGADGPVLVFTGAEWAAFAAGMAAGEFDHLLREPEPEPVRGVLRPVDPARMRAATSDGR